MKTKAASTKNKESVEGLRRRVGRMLSDIESVIATAKEAMVIAERVRNELRSVLWDDSHSLKVSLDSATERRSEGQRHRRRRRRRAPLALARVRAAAADTQQVRAAYRGQCKLRRALRSLCAT